MRLNLSYNIYLASMDGTESCAFFPSLKLRPRLVSFYIISPEVMGVTG